MLSFYYDHPHENFNHIKTIYYCNNKFEVQNYFKFLDMILVIIIYLIDDNIILKLCVTLTIFN